MPGLSVPYEEPEKPEIAIETDKISVEKSVRVVKKLIAKLRRTPD